MSRTVPGPDGPTTQPIQATQMLPDLAAATADISADGRTLHQATISQGMPSGLLQDVDIPAATGSRYRIVGMHARGGLGVVYVAEDTELRRRVALKEIQVRYSHDTRSRHRFVQEAEITGRLAHPGIVPVHGLGTHADGRPFYAMRFVEGETLLEAVQSYHKSRGVPHERRLGLRQLLTRFLDVCNAVAYAHSQGVIHRDLKPANVLLGRFGETLLVDWGLAKYMGVCQAETTALSNDDSPHASSSSSGDFTLLSGSGTIMGAAVGTPAYMSPEQADGRWDDVGVASDVYSLGATLYTVLTGDTPQPKVGNPETWLKVPLGGIRAPRELAPDTPLALEAICRKAMSPVIADRYGGALELAADVEHWLGDESVSALPEGILTRAGRWARRHLAIVSGVSASVLVLGVSLGVLVAIQANANKQISEANQQLRDANGALVEANNQIRAANTRTLKAVDNFFTDVSENPRLLRKEPGTQALRKALLERARDYYEGFLRDNDADAGLQIETAAACFRLAAIQEVLDPGPKALKLYERAREIRAQLATTQSGDPTRAFDLAVTQYHTGKLLHDLGKPTEALSEFGSARAALERLVAEHADDARFAKELGVVIGNIGVAQYSLGKLPEALAACEEARTFLERWLRDHTQNADIQHALATTLENLSALQLLANRPDAALAAISHSRALLEGLVRDYPDRTEFAKFLSKTVRAQASAFTINNRREEALTAYRFAREYQEKLVRENPGVADLAQELGVTYNNTGTLQRAMGRLADAVDSCSKALELQKKLAADHSNIPEFERDIARTHNNLGILLGDQLKRTEALASFQQAKNLQEQLIAKQPDNLELTQELGKSCHNMGNLLVLLGRRDEGRAAHEQARTIRAQLVERNKGVPVYRVDLVMTLLAIGELARDRGDLPAAIDACKQVLANAGALPEPTAKSVKRLALRLQAQVLSRLGQHAESLGAWNAAIELADGASAPLLAIGRAAAQVRSGDVKGLEAAQAVANDAKAEPALLIEAARVFAIGKSEKHLTAAFGLIKRAGEAGAFRDPARLDAIRIDVDFAEVCKRPEFAAWAEELQQK